MGNNSLLNTPTIYAIAGIPGAGKTTFRDKALRNGLLPESAFVYDCDAVMEQIPDYLADLERFGGQTAFLNWELAARQIALQQLEQRVAQQQDIIYDRSCALPDSYTFIKNAIEKNNYKLVIYYIYVNLKVACERVSVREKITARHLPLGEVALRAKMLQQLWPAYLELADKAIIIDNHYAEHEIIATIILKNLTIHHLEKYTEFNSVMGAL